jgi:glycosyltransferase involved in cell wall biosynthesis
MRLLKQFQKQKPDILHIQWSMLPVIDVMLVLRAQKMGVKVVHTVHDVTPLFDMGKHRRQEKLFQAVDALIVHSEESLKAFRERYSGVNPSKVHVIPHGPLQNENSENYSKVEARQQLGIPEEAPVALFFGEIKYYKGLHRLVECFPDVARAVDGAFLLIAGKPDSGESKPDTKLLDRCGVSYKADLGFVPNDDVWKYYHAADVVVLPYINISQSGVLFSAVANARPVVTTKVGGLPEIVEATNAGWVVTEGVKEELTAAISEALGDLTKTRELGLKARDKLNSLYGWDSIAEKTKSVYQSLLK